MRLVRFHVAIANKGIKDRAIFSYVNNKMVTTNEIIHFYCSSSVGFYYPQQSLKVASDDLLNISKLNVTSAYTTLIETIKSQNKNTIISAVNSKIVGKVTFSANNKFQIDNVHRFKTTCENPLKFRPIKGDLVIIELISNLETEIITISPLRIIGFDGIISSFNGNTGYIDGKIFIDSSISKQNPEIQLKSGTKVNGIAIESVRENRYSYRALQLSVINTVTTATTNVEKEINCHIEKINHSQKSTTINGSVLKFYEIPTEIETNVINNASNLFDKYPILNEEICQENYAEKFKLLLYLEEIQIKEEMKQFKLVNVRLIRRSGAFAVEVPGLSDGRLSLMVGQKVEIQLNDQQFSYCIGSIIEIDSDKIFVQTDPAFQSSYAGQECTVSFKHSTVPFRRMHFGIDLAVSLLMKFGIIFPDKIPPSIEKRTKLINNEKRELLELSTMKLFNSALNQQQQLAVLRIVKGLLRPLPYVLFGPPGTGKTVTLVEAILQIYKNDPSSRILICAPSNSAVDLLCGKLHETGLVTSGEMVRMVSKRQLHIVEMPDNHNTANHILPINMSIDKVQSILIRRIILSTCNTSEALYHVYRKPGHITHVFIDEAGQASEPDIMIPLGLISPENGKIILSGDPMQLGPVVRSLNAKQLEKSYLERLLYSCKIYQNDNNQEKIFNPLLCTQLIHNYRSHASLLELTSDLFYGGSLIACAKNTKFINWKWLPNPEVPLIFHKVLGKESHGSNLPSIYNVEEAKIVLKWIERLLMDFSDKDGLHASHINVITPYRAQVECIKKLLLENFQSHVVDQLKVASVEEFQGQENEVVIVSTVRSSFGINNTSYKSRLKFLSNNKRFNVSITRARSLLIAIGDHNLLNYDPCWNKFIKYADSKKCFYLN